MAETVRIALIPVYEPEELLTSLLRHIVQSRLQAIVVDDGSGSAYAMLFEQAKAYAMVLTHETNQGKGCAIKTGLQYIESAYIGAYTVVTMDADGQHAVEDAVAVCMAAERMKGALTLGSRELREGVPVRSRFGNTVTRGVYSMATGTHLHDTQTGLRAFSQQLVPLMLGIPGARYEYEMNVLLELPRYGIPIQEVRIATIYTDNNSKSHFHTIKDSYRIYKEILKYSASSFICFLVDYGLYGLLSALLHSATGLMAANIIARLTSAALNFTINRKLVFRSSASLWKSAAKYFALAAFILAGNTLVLSLLVQQAGMNRYLAKLLTEISFFLISWLVQRFFIFQKKRCAG